MELRHILIVRSGCTTKAPRIVGVRIPQRGSTGRARQIGSGKPLLMATRYANWSGSIKPAEKEHSLATIEDGHAAPCNERGVPMSG